MDKSIQETLRADQEDIQKIFSQSRFVPATISEPVKFYRDQLIAENPGLDNGSMHFTREEEDRLGYRVSIVWTNRQAFTVGYSCAGPKGNPNVGALDVMPYSAFHDLFMEHGKAGMNEYIAGLKDKLLFPVHSGKIPADVDPETFYRNLRVARLLKGKGFRACFTRLLASELSSYFELVTGKTHIYRGVDFARPSTQGLHKADMIGLCLIEAGGNKPAGYVAYEELNLAGENRPTFPKYMGLKDFLCKLLEGKDPVAVFQDLPRTELNLASYAARYPHHRPH